MAKTGVEVLGLKQANKALRLMPEFARDDAQQVMNVTAFQVSRAAASQAPSKTGLLRRSIAWKARVKSLSAVVTILKVAFYWKYIEFGTVRKPARPFMRPAAASMKNDHNRRLIQALEKVATKVSQAQGPVSNG